MPGFGRIPQPDQRNANYPIRALIDHTKPRTCNWTCKIVLDQGETPTCVGNAITHEIIATPVNITQTEDFAWDLYQKAQALDGIHTPHDGTSVLAGMKAATAFGYYREYRWATTVEDLALAISWHGPAILGINWYAGMMDTSKDGWLLPLGNVAGGHAVLARSIHIAEDNLSSYVTIHNSWGPDWGINGEGKLSLKDLARLLHEDGEAAIPVHRSRPHLGAR